MSLIVLSAFAGVLVVVFSSPNGLSSSSPAPSRHHSNAHSSSSADSYLPHAPVTFDPAQAQQRNTSIVHVKHDVADTFYEYSASKVKEYGVVNHSSDEDVLGQEGYYQDKDALSRNAEDLDTEGEELLPDSDSRRLSETVVRINSAIDTVSSRLHVLRDFVKESTDSFSVEGDPSDSLFEPCQDSAQPTRESNSVYGFVVRAIVL